MVNAVGGIACRSSYKNRENNQVYKSIYVWCDIGLGNAIRV